MSTELDIAGAEKTPKSLQIYQDVYNSMTGKTEVSNKFFYEAHQVTLLDIERLHQDFGTLIEQYHCTATSCHISVKYCNGKSEGFSGINRFKIGGINKSVATESIDIEYDFLVLLPKTSEPKPYKLVVSVRSTLGVVERHRITCATEAEMNIFFHLERGTAKMEVHYIDLAICRSIEALVDDWFISLRKEGSALRRRVKDIIAHTVPVFTRVTMIGASAGLSYYFLRDHVTDNDKLFSSGLSATTAIMISAVIAIPIANYFRKQVDRAISHSTIVLGDADLHLLNKSKSNMLKLVSGTVLKWLGAIALGLITTYCAIRLGLSA